MSDVESREHRRHAVRARCIARSLADGRLIADHTLDVSYSGVRLAALAPAALSERVRISIELPGTRVWVDGDGRVERVIAGQRAGDESAALGVRIDRMDGMRRLLLAQVARRYPETPRARGASRDYAQTIARIALDRRAAGAE